VVRGTPVVVTFRVAITSPLTDGTVIHNVAQISDGFQAGVLARSADTTIGSAPNLTTSSKEVNQASAAPGDMLIYTITLRNTGNAVAAGARITDTLPTNTHWDGWVTQNGATLNGNVITWMGDVAPGVNQVIAFRVHTNTPLDDGTTIQNVATINDNAGHAPFIIASPQTTIYSTSNLGTSTKAVNTANAAPGDVLTYTITLLNNGNMTARYAQAFDDIPANTTYVTGSANATGGTISLVGGRVRWTGAVTPGINVVITFRVQVNMPLDNGTQISNFASMDDGVHGTIYTNEVVTAIHSAPNLATSSKTVNLTDAVPGQTLHYVITLRNTGNMTAGEARITDTIPANTTLVGTPSASSGSLVWDPSARRITWSGAVQPGIPVTIDYYVTVYSPLDDGTLITNTATVDDGFAGHVPFETSPATQTTIHSAPDLSSSTKTVDLNVAAPGEVVEYTVTLNNYGTMNAHAAVMTDTLPTDVVWVGWSQQNGANYDSVLRQVSWSGALNVGLPVTIRYRVRLDAGLDSGAAVTNTATVDDGWGNVFETDPPAVTTVGFGVGLSLTDGRFEVQPGEWLTYTIAFSGTDPLGTGHILEVSLPAHATFISASAGYQNLGDGFIRWTLPQQPPNFYGERSLVVALATPLDNGTEISATAALDANHATDTDIIVSEPDLSTSAKTVSNTGAHAGELVTYNIVLSNTGTMNAYQALITDTLPASMTLEGDPLASSGVVTVDNGDVRWNGQVLVGTPVEITFNARVAQDAVEGSVIENYVAINDGFHVDEFGRSATIIAGSSAPKPGKIYLPFIVSRGSSTPPTGSYDVELTIYNCGAVDAIGAFWVDLYINPNESSMYWPPSNGEGYDWFGPHVTDGQGASFTVGTLGAGKSRTLHLSEATMKNVPATLSGTPKLYGQVDWVDGGSATAGHGVVEEGASGERNNFAGSSGATCAATAGMPDLIVTSIDVVNVSQQVVPAAVSPAVEGGTPAPERPKPPKR
jgi:uncharacterized repeat protein (TIGR01451 family)